MAPRVSSLVFVTGLLLLGGCGVPDISGAISDYVATVDGSRERLCDCAALQGYETIGECKDGLGQAGDAEEACVADALEGDEERGEEYLSCATQALLDYSDCLAGNASCEESVLDVCTTTKNEAVDSCGHASLRSSTDACAAH